MSKAPKADDKEIIINENEAEAVNEVEADE